MWNIAQKLKDLITYIKNEKIKNIYTPLYKLIEIIENEEGYTVVIKVINKNVVCNVKPEEILSNDELVDQFSPRDIRALTYLGYLGINSPQYKILAKKLSTQNDKIIFVLKKKGAPELVTKTADQILSEKDFILKMNSEDAKTVGYTIASESMIEEKKQKEELLKNLSKNSQNR